MIKAMGFASERFMNMLSYRGVYLWDVEVVGTGVRLKIPKHALGQAEACAEKTGCEMKVLGYGGLPAKFRRFRGRQALTAGLFIFAVGLYALASFVWVVQVEGNERLQKEDILTYCKEIGLYPGRWKGKVDTEVVTKRLLEEFPDISWVSVGVTGTDVTIRLAETIEKAEVVDKETPCDIVAAADGVVVKITAERGTPMVKVGDVVEKGDVLISAQVTIGLEGEPQRTEYVAAEGVITARIWWNLTDELPLSYEEKRYEGEAKENHSLLFWGREVDFVHPDMAGEQEKELLFEKELALGDFKLPIALKKELQKPYVMEKKSRSIEDAKTELEEILRKKTERTLSPYGTIEDIKIRYEEYTDRVQAKGEAVLLERIGQAKETTAEIAAEEGREAIDGTD